MKRFMLVVALLCATSFGCTFEETADKAYLAKDGAAVIATSIDMGNAYADMLERDTGVRLPIVLVERGKSWSQAVATGAQMVGAGAAALTPVVPYAAPIAALATGVAAIAGALARFFQNRGTKVARAAVQAATAIPTAGATLSNEAKKLGVGDYVESVYRETATK